jgi:hypothetical protein
MDPATKVQVICLPQPFPKSLTIESHAIFIRPFNVEMMESMIKTSCRRVVLVGNAGIGKLYMQLLILLWWARKELRPPGVDWKEFLDGIRVIARAEVERHTDLFIKNDQKHYFSESESRLPSFSQLDSNETLLLYEPCVSKHEIKDCGVFKSRLWATVSPLSSRYKEFSKNDCGIKYMDCPSESEVLFMATVLNHGLDTDSPLKQLFKHEAHQNIWSFPAFGIASKHRSLSNRRISAEIGF